MHFTWGFKVIHIQFGCYILLLLPVILLIQACNAILSSCAFSLACHVVSILEIGGMNYL